MAPSILTQTRAANGDFEKSSNYIKVVLGKQEVEKYRQKQRVYMM